jgi:hypothetical protein
VPFFEAGQRICVVKTLLAILYASQRRPRQLALMVNLRQREAKYACLGEPWAVRSGDGARRPQIVR